MHLRYLDNFGHLYNASFYSRVQPFAYPHHDHAQSAADMKKTEILVTKNGLCTRRLLAGKVSLTLQQKRAVCCPLLLTNDCIIC